MSASSLRDHRPLLALLADGQWHSGESIGRALGISRAAVWKRLQVLESLGVPVKSGRGLGYCLEGGLQLLESASIVESIAAAGQRDRLGALNLFDEIDSTNAWLLVNGRQRGDVCMAERQLAGRGRRGRQWIAPFGRNLCLSVSWTFADGICAAQGLSLATGVVLADVLLSMGLTEVQLKWPNDLLCGQRKLGGILIELAGGVSEDCRVVVGVGLNLDLTGLTEEQNNAIAQPWTDLRQMGLVVDRNQLAGALVAALLRLLHDYPRQGFGAYRTRWERLNAHQRQYVTVTSGHSTLTGRVLGVDAQGGLRLATDNGEQILSGGEISVRSLHES